MIVYSLREYFILERYFLKEESIGLNDNSEKYKLDVNKNKKNQHHKHDKLFREILSNKKEIVKLINKYLEPKEKITEEMIERYDTKFITTSYEEKESDIVFKLKNKEVFFLIEHQTKTDKLMAKRLTEYSLEIIRARKRENLSKKSEEMLIPRVIPLVLYTGQTKWTAKNKLEEIQVEFEHLKGVDIITGYNLIDIRDEEEAIKDGTAVARMSVIERKNNTEEIIETIKRMAEHIKDKEERKEFAKEVKYLLYGRLTKDEIEQIERILIEEEGEDAMLHAQMVIERDFKRAREEGRKEGMLHAQKVIERDFKRAREEGRKNGEEQKAINIAKKMLDEKIDINLITKITGLKKEQFME